MGKDKIKREWTESSENYDQIIHDEMNSFRPQKWLERILAQVNPDTHMKVLDIGCGPAFFTMILSGAGYDVTGIDFSEGMLEKARENVKTFGRKAEILRMDCENPEFPDDTFDLLISRNVTHTLTDHKTAYSQWKRILKPGGVLLIFDANWHLTLRPGPLRERYMEDVKECVRRFGSDFNGHSRVEDLPQERPSLSHPLGDLVRPDWDLGILGSIGFSELSYERDVTEKLWDNKEKLIYGTTPMFMIRAVKP